MPYYKKQINFIKIHMMQQLQLMRVILFRHR